jgi:hypothetical protein
MKEHKYSSRTVSFQHTYSATHMGKGKKVSCPGWSGCILPTGLNCDAQLYHDVIQIMEASGGN